MPLTGRVYKVDVDDLATFFAPIVLGEGPPSQGYSPWPGVSVQPFFFAELLGWIPIPFAEAPVLTQKDGSFTIPDPSNLGVILGLSGEEQDVRIALTAREGDPPYSPLYRTDPELPLPEAQAKDLELWLVPYTLPDSDGATAAMVSSVVQGAGLPGNTQITAGPSGLSFKGSRSGVNLEFGVSIVPDISWDLSDYLDLVLASWNISVGFPADICSSAEDVLTEIRSGLQGAGASLNEKVFEQMESLIEQASPELTQGLVKQFLQNEVSVTFMDVRYPTTYTWPLSSKDDATIVVLADPCIGYPRHLAADPTQTRPIPRPPRLSQILRPVLV
jgi:hypothetical protein